MSAGFIIVIPARHASTRLPGKPMQDIAGKPLVQHVYESALSSEAERVIVATDDERISRAVAAFGGHAVMTETHHQSGTDRITEAIDRLDISDETIIVNLQGDEFGLPPAIINQVPAAMRTRPDFHMATLCERLTDPLELDNPNIVKVIFNKDNAAIYFSRSAIPWHDAAPGDSDSGFSCQPYRHIGIYGYRAGFLRTFTGLPHCQLEQSEKLEQLRALYYGYRVYVEVAVAKGGVGVDTPEDLELARKIAEKTV